MRRKNIEGQTKYTAEELARYTRLLRKVLRIHTRKTTNLLTIFELLKKVFPKLSIRVVANKDLPGAEARAYPKRWVIKYTIGIQEGLLRGSARARWTFLHELGHVLLAHPGRPYRRDSRDDSPIEQEAHLFAAEFLAPAELVKEYKSIEDVSRAFQISYEAAERRVREVASRERRKKFGFRPQREIDSVKLSRLEDYAALICSTLLECVQSSHLPVEPHKNNVLGVSLLSAKAADLLMDSYESLRGSRSTEPSTIAAMLAAAICTVQPIREIGSARSSSKAVIALNQSLALKVAASAMLLEVDRMQNVVGAPAILATFRSQYLTSLMAFGDEILEGHPAMALCLYDTPSYASYNRGDDTSWCEIHALEGIIELMSVIRGREQL